MFSHVRQWIMSILVFSSHSVLADQTYDFPLTDPVIATVFGTPSAQKVTPAEDIPHSEETIDIFPDRALPEIVMATSYRYGTAFQEGPAPLIFIIAGTGGSHQGGKMKLLESAFYQAGFHVVLLSSPTYANFIMTASESHIPGNAKDDARDLYRVMRMIRNAHEDIQVTEYNLLGYSLGGANAAFVAELDSRLQILAFDKVLMINPPIDLYKSMQRVDQMLQRNIPGPVAKDFDEFFNQILARISRIYIESDQVDFNDELVYRLFAGNAGDTSQIRDEELEAVIGTSFRFASANMVTVADFSARRGYLVPKDVEFSIGDSTTPYFKAAIQVSFLQYLNEVYLPFFAEREPDAPKKQLVGQTSLPLIESFLKQADYVAAMHNADDIILGGDELAYLQNLLGDDRLTIYPHGGHLGNMDYPQNVHDIVNYFTD